MKKIILFFFITCLTISAQVLPTQKDFTIYRGDSTVIQFTASGDITGNKLTFVSKASFIQTGNELILKQNALAGGTGITASYSLTGNRTTISVTLLEDDTGDLTAAIYYYDLFSQAPGTGGGTIYRGALRLNPDIYTKWDGTDLPAGERYVPVLLSQITDGYVVKRSGSTFIGYDLTTALGTKLALADSNKRPGGYASYNKLMTEYTTSAGLNILLGAKLDTALAKTLYLKMDQTTPQSVINGSPIMEGVQFDTTPSTTNTAEGLLRWNSTDGTLDLGMSGGDVTMQVGQELFVKVRNPSGGATITNGSVVYTPSRTGVYPNIALAKSDSLNTSCVLGIATQDIASPGYGYITTFGYVRGIKTDYTGTGIWGTTWAENDKLYVSKTNAGVLTNVEPAVPHYSDIVGTVGVVHATQGSILVVNKKHSTLQSLSDINGTALATTGQIPVWDNTNKYFDFNYNITNYFAKADSNILKNPITLTYLNTQLGAKVSVADSNTLSGYIKRTYLNTQLAGKVNLADSTSNGYATRNYVRTTFAPLISPSFTTPVLGVATGTSFNSVALQSVHKVYFMGNSLTSNGVYPNAVGSLLGIYWSIVNKGTSGNTTTQMLARFATDITDNTDCEYVSILAGINDIIQGASTATIQSNLQAMYTNAHNAGIKVIASTILPAGGVAGWTAEMQTKLETVNTWILNTAINIDYEIDAYSTFNDPGNSGSLLAIYDSGDHLHLNISGYKLLGTTIYNGTTFTPRMNFSSGATLAIKNTTAKIDQDVSTTASPSFLNLTTAQTAEVYIDGSAFVGTPYTMATQYIAVKVLATGNYSMGDYTIQVKGSGTFTNPTETLTGYIYSDNAGAPGTLLATGGSIRLGTLTTSYQVLSVGTIYSVVQGTTYWLILKYSAAPTGANIVVDSDVATAYGATSANGSSWTGTDVRFYYQIRGTNNIGISSTAVNNNAVYGFSTNNYGVYGSSKNNYGVYGESTNNTAGRFFSPNFYGVYGKSTASIGVYGESTSNVGGAFLSTSGDAIQTSSVSGLAGSLSINPSSTNSLVEVLRIRRQTSGTAANNIGGSIDYYVENASGTSVISGRLSNILTNATASSETSNFGIWTRTGGGALTQNLTLDGSGNLTVTGSITVTTAIFTTLPTYADNAAALAGGLTAGMLYKTSTGVLMVTY